MKKLSILVLCAVLAACGGGGGNTASPAGPAQPSATLALTSNVMRTVTGGAPITLNATLSSGGTVHWKLADGAPGTLSADTGASVKYTPAAINAADTPSAQYGGAALTYVPVTATGDGASATLTLAVSPNPGPARLTQMSFYFPGSTTGGSALPASLANTKKIAADGMGTVYVLDYDPNSTTASPQVRLSKGSGQILVSAGNWFDAPDQGKQAARLHYFSGLAADRAGNLYISTAADGAAPASAAILKLTPAGSLSLLAGSESGQAAAITDGSGGAARFSHPEIVGIDPDDNLYVRDANDTPRKVTPVGVVTTLKAFPAGLNADMKGNTYRFDAAAKTVVRTAPDGSTAVAATNTDCGSACLNGATGDIVPLGGATFAVLSGDAIGLLVVPQSAPAPAPALALSSITLRTIAGGTPVTVTATGTGTGAVSWKLGAGAPGTLSAASGTSVTYTPPPTIASGTLVPVMATRDGATVTLTLAVFPDPGPPGLYLVAGNGQPSRDDGPGPQASFMFLKNGSSDLGGNIYLYETTEDFRPQAYMGFILRKISPDGMVTTPTLTGERHLDAPRSLAADAAGNVYVGQALLGGSSASIQKISTTGALSLLAGTNSGAGAFLDGIGGGARFVYPLIAGIDYDNVMYVRDAPLVRKVTLDGTVTTIPAVPRNLQADMNGVVYSYDSSTHTFVGTTPSGQTSVVVGTPGCTTVTLGALPGCIPYGAQIIPYGGSAFILMTAGYVYKLVLPH